MLKLAGTAGAAVLLGSSDLQAKEIKSSLKEISKKRPLHIAIIGGGMAGTAMAYRLSRAITYPVITLYEPEEKSCWYQPGLQLLGTGLMPFADLAYERERYIPQHTSTQTHAVTAIDAENLTVTDSSGKSMKYDYIIIASGLQLDFSAIKGLDANIGSLQTLDKTSQWMNDPYIGSVYYLHGAVRLSKQLDAVSQNAKEGKVRIFFTQPSVSVKSPTAAISALMALLEKLEKSGVKKRAEIVFVSGDGKLSANSAYDKRYKEILKKRGVLFRKDTLLAINTAERKATFLGSGELPYDFIHLTPPMKAGAFLSQSGVLGENGLVDVHEKTLEHKRYSAVFAIGDIAGCPTLKSASAISEQVKTITDTIRKLDEGEKPEPDYDGYGCDTVICPADKTVLNEAWDYKKNPLSVPFGLDPLKCHTLYWYDMLYFRQSYLMNGVLRGWA